MILKRANYAKFKSYQVDFYNVIISVGYRVKSSRGTQFRMWVTGILKEEQECII